MKRKNSGITLIEILTVLAIIVILAGLLIPAMNMARKAANQTKQKAELNAIELALVTFKNDYGDYPPSSNGGSPCPVATNDYCGAQKLTEALCGWDLLGFHPNSKWRSDGADCNTSPIYPTQPLNSSDPAVIANLKMRKGPYLDMTSISVFKLSALFTSLSSSVGTLKDTYVLCDIFGVRNVQSGGKNVRAGTPILYYKANTASKYYDITSCSDCSGRIYDFGDNKGLTGLGKVTSDGTTGAAHSLDPGDNGVAFYKFIRDSRVPITTITTGWPYNPDSYILISAGPDGEYGTSDDICNF